MGITKTDFFTQEQNEIANLLKALAHPARVAIVQYLLKVNTCICNDIVTELPLAQPTISQHLVALKNANLIQGTIEGRSICYCLNYEMFSKIGTYFISVSNAIENKCC